MLKSNFGIPPGILYTPGNFHYHQYHQQGVRDSFLRMPNYMLKTVSRTPKNTILNYKVPATCPVPFSIAKTLL